MSKIIITLTLLTLALAGCVRDRSTFIDLDLACRDRFVTVVHTPVSIVVAPPFMEVCPESTITVRIRPREAGETIADSSTPGTWLNESTDAGGNITIEVPAEPTLDEYKYSVRIQGSGTIDPRIRIIR